MTTSGYGPFPRRSRRGRATSRTIQALEPRRLLDAVIDGQTFGVRGTAGNDVISVVLDETDAAVTINGDVTNLTVEPQLRMRVFLDAGDDQLTVTLIGRSIPATVYGGAGDDSIDFLALDERLLVFGEDGNDSITLARSSPTTPTSLATTVYGGGGDDFIDGSPAPDFLSGDGRNDTISGNAQRDSIYGGDGRDSIGGGRDRDLLRGQAGDDSISGGSGDDSIEGNGGDDVVAGNDGNDRIGGGDGVNDGAGNDTIVGGNGDDSMWDGQGSDLLIGGEGDDSHFANQSQAGDFDLVYGGAGDDSLNSDNNTSQALIDCGPGNDRVFARGRQHTIFGGTGNDVLRGGFQAADSIDGGDGDDIVLGESGGNSQDPTADTLRGGPGRDQFVLDEFAAGEVKDYTHGEDVDPYLSVVLDEFNEQVLRITGNAGTDRVTIEPDPADGSFFRVTSQQSRNPAPVVARFPSSKLGFLIVDLGSGNDVLEVVGVRILGEIPRVGPRPVDIAPGPGDDYVRFDAAANAVRFQGGGGNDTFDNNPDRGGPKALHGGPGNDTLIGGRSNDFIDGGAGNDVIEGHAQADNLLGGDGDDQIDGGRAAKSLDGVDTIQGGLGRDTVAGYAGVDRIFGFLSSPFGNTEDNPNVFDRVEALGLEVRDYREGIDVIV